MIIFKLCVSLMLLGFLSLARQAEGQEEAPSVASKELVDSQAVAEDWLKVVDSGDYGKSWTLGSHIFQSVISQAEWATFLENVRKPYGKLEARKLVEQRTAKDPKGLPQGDYMVVLYESSFAQKKKGLELVTLIFTDDKVWKVLTYQITQQ